MPNNQTLIITPTYNEKENIVKLIPQIFQLVEGVDVLVIDDNSPDQTAELVKQMQNNYPNLKISSRPGKLGLGTAYISGFKQALAWGYKYIITMDADFSHDPKYIPGLIDSLTNNDLVIGSRYIPGGGVKNWPLKRILLSRLGNLYAKTILHTSVNDNTAGFMAIKTDFLRQLNLDAIRGQGYAFLMELKYIFFTKRARIKEIPIVFVERVLGKSKISSNIIKEGLLMPWQLRIKYGKK
ncbi:MAG: polyprenol monophosphomannose synthase [Patescibacteria group bacterium]